MRNMWMRYIQTGGHSDCLAVLDLSILYVRIPESTRFFFQYLAYIFPCILRHVLILSYFLFLDIGDVDFYFNRVGFQPECGVSRDKNFEVS